NAGIAGKILVTGKPAEAEPEPDTRLKPNAVFDRHSLETNIVGILQHRYDAGTVEANIELARQAVERAIIENVKVPFARIWPGIYEFLRINACGGGACDIANVVGARTARTETEILNGFDHRNRIVGRDFTYLQIGSRGDVRIAAPITLRQIGNTGKLRRLEDSIRQTQPAHVRILIGRHIKQAEKPPTEIVRRLWVFAFGGVGL